MTPPRVGRIRLDWEHVRTSWIASSGGVVYHVRRRRHVGPTRVSLTVGGGLIDRFKTVGAAKRRAEELAAKGGPERGDFYLDRVEAAGGLTEYQRRSRE